MPVRSLHSSVLRWPDAAAVAEAVRSWGAEVAAEHPQVRSVGYFGSYARGDWGVGSDVDIVIVVERTDEPFERRALAFDATGLPVPADVLVYSAAEWEQRSDTAVARETVWVFPR